MGLLDHRQLAFSGISLLLEKRHAKGISFSVISDAEFIIGDSV
jgi:hypothetical protein